MSKKLQKQKNQVNNPDPKVLETTEEIFKINNILKVGQEPEVIKAVDAWGAKKKR